MEHTATYSPEDNKLRLYPACRLPKDEYDRMRARGFIWAPKQELFVAPMWTPEREDLLLELAGEIGDEDKSLVERAEDRADRFQDYSASRADDAAAAHKAVHAIADNIPLGQPILVGHHSEKRARRDAEKIQDGMRRAVKMWETSEYWKDRAAGAIRAAKYKERPDVRARRIKGLQADFRKQERNKAEAIKFLSAYEDPEAAGAIHTNPYTGEQKPLLHALLGTYEGGLGSESRMAFEQGSLSFDDALAKAKAILLARIAYAERWLAHYAHRIEYEKAMLGEQGGTAADRNEPQKGGGCQCWASPRGGWSWIVKVNKVSVTVLDNWGNSCDRDGSRNFTRTIPFDKLRAVMNAAAVQDAKAKGLLLETEDKTGFYLRPATDPEPKADNVCPDGPKCPDPECQAERQKQGLPIEQDFEAMRETLRQGVKIVSAPQLFPTPAHIAQRMVEIAFENGWGVLVCPEMNERCRILEPSAGTGNIVRAIQAANQTSRAKSCEVHAIEINHALAEALRPLLGDDVHCADFLECNGDLGKFDRILMNPPFENGSDVKHILHARTFLNPGGRLVAVCANGPRQQEKLQPLCDSWEPLPAGTFANQGTGVNTVLLTMSAEG